MAISKGRAISKPKVRGITWDKANQKWKARGPRGGASRQQASASPQPRVEASKEVKKLAELLFP